MFRFLHTADWQIGMKASGLGPASEKVRAARLDALQNLLELAAEKKVDAILVAGDVFEDNQVAESAVQQVANKLNDATACPIFLLPGNHDPLTLSSVWRRNTWKTLRSHIRVMTEAKPIEIAAGVALFPCPIMTKHGTDDPTAWIPPRMPGDTALRVGLAHGTMRIRPDVGDDDFPIPIDAAARAGLDYLAVGHWHSTLASRDGRAWYSGTHETTKFGERDSGGALLVTLTTAGAPPQIEPIRTGTLKWADHAIDLAIKPADAMLRRLRDWPDADRQLLRLLLTGRMTADTTAVVGQLRELVAGRFLHATVDDSALRPADADAAALESLNGSPYLQNAAEELRHLAVGATNGSDPAVAARALEILHEAAWTGRSHSATQS